MSRFSFILAASATTDLLVALLLLFVLRRRSPPHAPAIDARRWLRAITLTFLVVALKARLLAASEVDFFGIVHLVYLCFVVVLPLAGAACLGAAAWRRLQHRQAGVLTRGASLLSLCALSLAAVGYYASFVEPTRLQIEEARLVVPARRSGEERVRLGVLADLQTRRVTDYERAAVTALVALEPDVILVPGDVFQGTAADFHREREALVALLLALHAPGGVFVISGNADSHVEELMRLLEGTHVKFLDDRIERVHVGDRVLRLAGLPWVNSTTRERFLRAIAVEPDEGDILILVSHYPDVALSLPPKSRVDLTVAGHTHGGQVRLPFLGPLLTASHVPRHIAAGGLHRMDGNAIYVSRGVGMERGQAPPLRFLCPPEISLITLAEKR